MATLMYLADAMCTIIEGLLNDATAGVALGYLNRAYLDLLYGAIDPRTGSVYSFRFLKISDTITIWPKTTGTALGAVFGDPETTITTTADTFFETMVGHTLTFDDSGDSFVVLTYTSATEIDVTGDASGEVGNAFTLTPTGRYPLPSTFRGVRGDAVYSRRTSQSDSLGRLRRRGVEAVDVVLRDGDGEADQPNVWAVEPVSAAIPQTWTLVVGLVPDQLYDIRLPYLAAAAALTDTAIGLLGPPEFSLAVLHAARALAADETGEGSLKEDRNAAARLVAAIDADRRGYTANGEPEGIEDD